MFNNPKKYDPVKDLERETERIRQIEGLTELLSDPRWKKVDTYIDEIQGAFLSDIITLSDDPRKNEIEIRCKKLVSDALRAFLTSLRHIPAERAKAEKQYDYKLNKIAEQRQRTLEY